MTLANRLRKYVNKFASKKIKFLLIEQQIIHSTIDNRVDNFFFWKYNFKVDIFANFIKLVYGRYQLLSTRMQIMHSLPRTSPKE